MRAFEYVAASALLLGLLGLVKLEPRSSPLVPSVFGNSNLAAKGSKDLQKLKAAASESYSLREMASVITADPSARAFFIYLLLLLAAILGQDVLLEPFAAEAFGMTVTQTTRITSIWGAFVLAAIIIAGLLEGRLPKKTVAQAGNLGALGGFVLIVSSGIALNSAVFYLGVTLLGAGTGLSTVANLSLMFDFTAPGMVGLYIGAWGFSNALSRLTGSILGGVLRDVVTQVTGAALAGYLVVFGIEAFMLFTAAAMLARINISGFQKGTSEPAFVEKVALAGE
jgi:BCD family chlorophyll transporter-like MFS transporter